MVKQSLSLPISMLAGSVSVLPAAGAVFLVEYVFAQNLWAELAVKGGILILSILGGTLLYRSCCRVSWKALG